jgi:hypothetical protein
MQRLRTKAKEGAEKSRCVQKSVPRRLKPRGWESIYGTASDEGVPLTKREFSSTCEGVPLRKTDFFSAF